MATKLAQREQAIEATEATCPRCGAPRAADQQYCLECGLALPVLAGTVPGLRRRWLRRLGWYPGDWVWISLLTLLVAIAGAAVAVAVTKHDSKQGPSFVSEPPVPSVTTAATPTFPATTAPAVTLPTPPEQTTPATTTGTKTRTTKPKPVAPVPVAGWPANVNGWTVVLVSYPSDDDNGSAQATAARAAKAGLTRVGVLDSSDFASLQPGYDVVFTGVYPSQAVANAAVGTARAAGFAGAYARQIAR